MPFESLDAVSYSPSIVTMAVSVAVCEIFSVKECCDLENQVRGSFKVIKKWRRLIDHMQLSKWSAIVNIALSCTIFELFDVE